MEENKAPESVPYIIHEGAMARLERTIKRLWILCIVIFISLVGTNAYWIWYENQFEDIVMTQEGTTDGGGNVSLNGVASGDINYYGESEANNTGKTP